MKPQLGYAPVTPGFPDSPLLEGTDGYLYGVGPYDGDINFGGGGVFSFSPQSGSVTDNVNFSGAFGFSPTAPLTAAPNGYLYGTTEFGGYGVGVIYAMSSVSPGRYVIPNSFNSYFSFFGGSDALGATPTKGALTLADDGRLYGANATGGLHGYGTIYAFAYDGSSPPISDVSSIWSFNGQDGAEPRVVVSASNGTFFGVTARGGDFDLGTIFKLVVDGTNSSLNTIGTFNGFNGSDPEPQLVLGPDGNYYGMTRGGGAYGKGVIYRIAPDGNLATLVTFNGTNGAAGYGGLVLGHDGNFYGTAQCGGAHEAGTIFRLTTDGTLTTLLDVDPGAGPIWNMDGAMMETSGHQFYGQCAGAGAYGFGALFRMDLSGSSAALTDVADMQVEDYTAPNALTAPAVEVTGSTAVLRGLVNSYQQPIETYFRYGLEDNATGLTIPNGTLTPSVSYLAGTSTILVSTTITGLKPSTTYYFQAEVTGSTPGLPSTYTAGTLPFSTFGKAAISYRPPVLTATTALLIAEVNPGGYATTAFIQYGLTTKYGKSSPPVSVGGGVLSFPVSLSLPNEDAGPLYHYRAVAESKLGTVYGPDETFIPAIPFPATLITQSGINANGLVFSSFTSPDIDDYGNIEFEGTEAGVGTAASKKSVILDALASPGGISYFERYHTGDDAPGIDGGMFSEFGAPVVNGYDSFAFLGKVRTVPGKISAANDTGLWCDTSDSLALIARTGQAAPGVAGARIATIDQMVMTGSGGPDFLAHMIVGAGGVTAKDNVGLWSCDASGSASLVARTGESLIIDGTTSTITAFQVFPVSPTVEGQSRSFNSSGTLLYQASFHDGSTGILTSTNELLAKSGDPAPGRTGSRYLTFGPAIINDSGHVAFQARVSGSAPKSKISEGVWADVGSNFLSLIALSGTTAPGTDGAIFTHFYAPVYDQSDSVAFVATLQPMSPKVTAMNNIGVWSTTGGTLHLVARAGDFAQGYANAKFSTFQQVVCTNSDRVAFLANVSGPGINGENNKGLWAVDAQGIPQLVARTGGAVVINGVWKVVSQIDVFASLPGVAGQTRSVNSSNLFCYRAVFTDGSEAVLISTPF